MGLTVPLPLSGESNADPMSQRTASKLHNPDGLWLNFNYMFKILWGIIYDAHFLFLCELFHQIYTYL